MEKLLSVIVPSYNMEAYLPKCLGSLLIDDKELFQALDVIVVNDGSKDRTSEIAHEFEAKYPGVFRVIDKPNGHYGSCVNAALKVAEGRFVKMLDADDTYITENLKLFLSFLLEKTASNDIDLIVMDMEIVNPFGRVTCIPSFSIGDGVYALDDFPSRMYSSMAIHAVAIRRGIFKECNYSQTEGIPYTDLEMVFMPLSRVRRVMCFAKPVVRYLLGREGQSFSPANQRKDCMKRVQVIRKHLDDYVAHESEFVSTTRNYMSGRLVNRLKLAYASMLGSWQDFAAFDDALRNANPRFYKMCEDLTVTRFNFRFVAEWRRARSFRTFKFLIYRLATGLRLLFPNLFVRQEKNT